jgi:FlaA1/EpsC-like NDP-sugar epimerase
MLDLAKAISEDVEIVGRRPGEKTDEDLVSEHELDYTYVIGNDIHIRTEKNDGDNKLDIPYNSKSAEKMSQKEIKELVEWV